MIQVKWSQEIENKLIELWNTNMKVSDIILKLKLNCSVGAITKKISRLRKGKKGIILIKNRDVKNQFQNKVNFEEIVHNIDLYNEEKEQKLDYEKFYEENFSKPIVDTKYISIIKVTDETCKFPMDYLTGVGHVFCGKKIVFNPKRPYCNEHSKIVYETRKVFVKKVFIKAFS